MHLPKLFYPNKSKKAQINQFEGLQGVVYPDGRLAPSPGLTPQINSLDFQTAPYYGAPRQVMESRHFTTIPHRNSPQGIIDNERDVYYCDYPRFHVGHSWYPGIDPKANLHGTMGDTQSAFMLRLTPPIIVRQGGTPSSIRQGIYQSSATNFGVYTYPLPPSRKLL